MFGGRPKEDVWGVCNFIGSVLPQQKFEVTDGLMLQLSFTWQARENTSSRHESRPTQKTRREERRGSVLAPPFICFSLLSLSLPCMNWAS